MALIETRFTVLGLNPNDVAAFLVVLMLSLPISLFWFKHAPWILGPTEAALLALLIGTGSRGGVCALIGGLVVAGICCWCTVGFSKRRVTWILIILLGIVGTCGGFVLFPEGFRLGNVDVSPEASAGRRLEVWSLVPAMLVSAPNGWGWGEAAEAYEQWFEPVGEAVPLKHLLSSHLTWLVEMSWPLRWTYFFLWIATITLLVPNRSFHFPFWGVAVWTAFFIALFYNAAGKWWNWPLPMFWVFAVIIMRLKQKAFPFLRSWLSLFIFSGLFVVLPFTWTSVDFKNPLIRAYDGGNIILIGPSQPTIALLGPSSDVLGNFYGQDVRKALNSKGDRNESVVVVMKPDEKCKTYLKNCKLFVISGGDEKVLDKWRISFTPTFNAKLVLINCRASPDDWVKVFNRVLFFYGEFYPDPNYEEWKVLSSNDPAISVANISEHETYIPDWWQLLDEAAGK